MWAKYFACGQKSPFVVEYPRTLPIEAYNILTTEHEDRIFLKSKTTEQRQLLLANNLQKKP